MFSDQILIDLVFAWVDFPYIDDLLVVVMGIVAVLTLLGILRVK